MRNLSSFYWPRGGTNNPNTSVIDIRADPIGDPAILDEYLVYILNLPGAEEDGHSRIEIARVRFALYRWVVYMLEHPSTYDLSVIEDFVDDDYQRLLVGYYIHSGDVFNPDQILGDLLTTSEVNADFATGFTYRLTQIRKSKGKGKI